MKTKIMAAAFGLTLAAGLAFGDIKVGDKKDGAYNKTTIRLQAETFNFTYAGFGTNHVAGVKIFDFPEGRILVHGVVVDNFLLTGTTGIATNEGGDFACGTVTAAGDDITSTEVDLCPKTSADPFIAPYDAALAASAQFDGTTTPVDMYLNVLVDTGDLSTNGVATVNASIEILWSLIGDN